MNNYESIEYDVVNGVATIAFNNPKTMNALTRTMRSELMDSLASSKANDEVKVIVITGRGKSFGSGQDLSDTKDLSMGVVKLIEEHMKPIIQALHESPKPVISAINGACAGVSASIAMACDLSVMAEDAYIFMAFAGIGLIPDGGASWHLVNQMGYKRAYQAIIEAERLTADKCLELGLVNKIAAPESLMQDTQTWAEKLAGIAPLSMRYTKEALRASMQTNLLGAVSAEAPLQEKCGNSDDFKEGVQAFMQKRKPIFTGK